MYKELRKANHDKASELFKKRQALAQKMAETKTIEEATAVLAEMKEVEEEAKKNDEELGMLSRYETIHKDNSTKKIGLT